MNNYERLLEAYNDYIEVEFQDRRNTKLDVILGLMYTTDDNGDDVEMWYDTENYAFYGSRDSEIVFELGADYGLASKIIESNGFDESNNELTEGDELYGINC